MAKNKAPTKTEIFTAIAEDTELSRKQVSSVFDALGTQIKKSLAKHGMFAIPQLVKIEKRKVPARPAKKHVPNPFKPGEFMDVKAKPASTKLKVRALAGLKGLI
jgi:nucleoid DNA-binding protein